MNFARACSVLLLVLAACGGPLKYQLRGTQISPGADATVVAKVDDGLGKTELEIDAKNLAPPDRLLDDGKVFVVWARKDEKAQWSRLGALETEDEGRSGKGRFTTSETAFDLVISAEKDAQAASPSGKTVFEQRVSK
jgi:hypothetical protein